MAVHKDIAVVFLRIAYPHECATARDGAMVEERRSPSQYSVAASIDAAVVPITTAIGLQCIAVSDDVYVLKEEPLSVVKKSLCLTFAVGLDCQITHDQVAAVVGSEGGTPRGECALHLIGLDVCGMRIEHLVVGVVDEYAFS